VSKFIVKRLIAAGVGTIGIYDSQRPGRTDSNILFITTDTEHTSLEITDHVVITSDCVIRTAGNIQSIRLEVLPEAA